MIQTIFIYVNLIILFFIKVNLFSLRKIHLGGFFSLSLLFSFWWFCFENIKNHHTWKCKYFFEIGLYSKICRIFLENHFKKSSKFIRFFVRIKGVNDKISKKAEHKISEKLKTKSEKLSNCLLTNYRKI
jgi:hypothetical protein